MNEEQLQALVEVVEGAPDEDFWHLHPNGRWDWATTEEGDCRFHDGPLALAVVIRGD